MKIYQAFDDAKIRRGYKKFIMARGLSVFQTDTIYTRFSNYISRIRSVGFDKKLCQCDSEDDLRQAFDDIFKDKWKDHLGYPEIPEHFYTYIDYLQALKELDPMAILEIEGLSPVDDACMPMEGFTTRFEKPYIKYGKLNIIANPYLIKKLKEIISDPTLTSTRAMNKCSELCRQFYSLLELDMTADDWKERLSEDFKLQKSRSKSSTIRSITIEHDGLKQVLNGTQAIIYVAEIIGYDKLRTCKVKNHGSTLLTRTVPKRSESNFKLLDNGCYLNLLGTVNDKYKVIVILNSMYNLGLDIKLTTDIPKMPRKRKAKKFDSKAAEPAAKPKEPVEYVKSSEESIREISDDDFFYGSNGTLNLFD